MRYVFIKAETQAEGNLHLYDTETWTTVKALIKTIRVVTSSTDWDLYLLQNDNGYAADDANIPKMQIVEAGNGNLDIHLDHPYEDEDNSAEVHLYYIDNEAANTADFYIIGLALDELATAAALTTHDSDVGVTLNDITFGVATAIDDIATHATALTAHNTALSTHCTALTAHAAALGIHHTALSTHAASFTFTDGNVHAVGMATGVLPSGHWPNL